MKYLFGVSLPVLLLAGTVAQAIPVPVVWTSEDFDDYAQGAVLGDLPGWAKTASNMYQPTVRGVTGVDNQIRLWGKSASGSTWSDAWNGDDGWTQQSAGVVGIVTFDLWGQLNSMSPARTDHFLIQISDQEDEKLGSVNGCSSSVKIKDASGAVLSDISYADGVHHNLAFVVDPIAGTVDYLLDGASVGTQSVGVGRSLGWIYARVDGSTTDLVDIIRFDNLVAGTVPEPTSLLLLGLGGLLVLRRRCA